LRTDCPSDERGDSGCERIKRKSDKANVSAYRFGRFIPPERCQREDQAADGHPLGMREGNAGVFIPLGVQHEEVFIVRD
jgi:hypothetical protein